MNYLIDICLPGVEERGSVSDSPVALSPGDNSFGNSWQTNNYQTTGCIEYRNNHIHIYIRWQSGGLQRWELLCQAVVRSARGPTVEVKCEKKYLSEYFKQYLLFSILCSDSPHRNSIPTKIIISTFLSGCDNVWSWWCIWYTIHLHSRQLTLIIHLV